jgi:DNA-binding NtrC family response regulator
MEPENTNVLIVDDDVNFCNTLAKIFIKKGYKTVTAESGLRALEMIEKKTFDIVLMDIKMPVMDGVETFKKMKAIRPDIAVILMTAFSVDDLIADALKEGVYSVVRKPFDIDTVINMMEKARNGALLTVVDDDPNICKTMKNILEKKGYSVTTCATGEEAISLAKDRSQDILFIDMKLPVLNGLEVYAEIKKINPKAIMVLMTAYREEMDEMVKEAIENGAYCCLYKPLDMDEVIKLIDKICKEMHKGG